MYISICEVLNKRLKAAIAERYGIEIGNAWPDTVADPLNAKIDSLNDAAVWEDEDELRQEIADLRADVVEHFPHIERQPEPEETEQTKPKAKAKAKKEAK